MRGFDELRKIVRRCFYAGLGSCLLGLAAQSLFAASCAVVHHPAASAADTAFLAGDFSRSTELYKEALGKDPGSFDFASGLVHSLLRQGRVLEAADELHSVIGNKPPSAALLTLRAELELREGEPWTAAETAAAAAKLDPCNPRTLLVLARLAALNSQDATAKKLLVVAHQLDPEGPEIWAAWMDMLPAGDRIPALEAYLAVPRGDDAEQLNNRKTDLEELKKWAEQPHPPCTLASTTTAAEIPFSSLRTVRGDTSYGAVDVKVNGHNARLSIDTSYNARLPIEGVSGLLILKSAADHMGLKPLFQNKVPGIGPQAARGGYVAYADSITIGDVEFHNCAVQVMEGNYWSDADGSMSLNLLSNFLVTLDYPANKLVLDPLPPLPAQSGGLEHNVPPEMKDYAPIYRAGTDMLLPVLVNNKYPMLFLIDTSMGYTMLSPEAAHQVAEGHKDSKYEVRDTSGNVDTRFSAGDVSLAFAHLNQHVNHIATFDTSRFTRDCGMEVSGFIGDNTLHPVAVRLDLRDGLLKLDFKR